MQMKLEEILAEHEELCHTSLPLVSPPVRQLYTSFLFPA